MRALLILLLPVLLFGCVEFKTASLFEFPADKKEPANINGFYSLDILQQKSSSDAWYSPEKECIEFKASTTDKYSGTSAVHVKWDKQKGACDWIGMGMGWDGWASKDLVKIMDIAAIQFKVLSKEDSIKSLPLAIGFEDYGETEAWVGVLSKYISYKNGEKWATVQIPIADFDWMQFEADPSNIKQLKLQFEASGDFIFDAFKVVEIERSSNRTYSSVYTEQASILVDGDPQEVIWENIPSLNIGNNLIKILSTDKSVFISGTIQDESLMKSKGQNSYKDSDAIEVILSTNSDAYHRRKNPLYSDQHLIFTVNKDPIVWDVRKKRMAEKIVYKTMKQTEESYSFEAEIPLEYLEVTSLLTDANYNLQVVINNLDEEMHSSQQIWNGASAQYATDPSTWGQIIFSKSKIGISQ